MSNNNETGRSALIEGRDEPTGTDTFVGDLSERYKEAQESRLSDELAKMKRKYRDVKHWRNFWRIFGITSLTAAMAFSVLYGCERQKRVQLFKPGVINTQTNQPNEGLKRDACKILGLDYLTYKKMSEERK